MKPNIICNCYLHYFIDLINIVRGKIGKSYKNILMNVHNRDLQKEEALLFLEILNEIVITIHNHA